MISFINLIDLECSPTHQALITALDRPDPLTYSEAIQNGDFDIPDDEALAAKEQTLSIWHADRRPHRTCFLRRSYEIPAAWTLDHCNASPNQRINQDWDTEACQAS